MIWLVFTIVMLPSGGWTGGRYTARIGPYPSIAACQSAAPTISLGKHGRIVEGPQCKVMKVPGF